MRERAPATAALDLSHAWACDRERDSNRRCVAQPWRWISQHRGVLLRLEVTARWRIRLNATRRGPLTASRYHEWDRIYTDSRPSCVHHRGHGAMRQPAFSCPPVGPDPPFPNRAGGGLSSCAPDTAVIPPASCAQQPTSNQLSCGWRTRPSMVGRSSYAVEEHSGVPV